jgi:ribose/xylose/arabinose/galactoside ABC-type transport system permease subunit
MTDVVDTRPPPRLRAPSPGAGRPLRRWLPDALSATPIWSALVVILVVGWVVVSLDGGSFFASGNLTNILQRSVALGIVSVGQTVAILAGSLDLSVSYLISLSSLIGAETMDGRESMLIPGIALTVAVGAAVGLANGLIITKLRVNAFIATLGMALILRGYIENNYDRPTGAVPESWESFGYSRIGPVPVSIFLFVGVALVVGLALRRTRWGYHVYAVGGDEQVSVLSGLRTHRVVIAAHVICSVCAALTGLFLASRLGSGTPRVGTDGGYDLESIAAVVLGGTALAGGRGRVSGTVGAVLVLAVLDNIFNQLELDPFLKQAVRGVVIIAAVAIYASRRGRRRAAATGIEAAAAESMAGPPTAAALVGPADEAPRSGDGPAPHAGPRPGNGGTAGEAHDGGGTAS